MRGRLTLDVQLHDQARGGHALRVAAARKHNVSDCARNAPSICSFTIEQARSWRTQRTSIRSFAIKLAAGVVGSTTAALASRVLRDLSVRAAAVAATRGSDERL